MKKYLLPALLAAMLSACGGGGGSSDGGSSATAATTADAFVRFINANYAVGTEGDEPQAIESVAVTSPEDTEPVAL